MNTIKILTVFSAGATKYPVIASMIPIVMPAISAPGNYPNPPIQTATKASSPNTVPTDGNT